ncbi:MAG: hypothetical protein ACRENE_07880 [Polyangiaceae bacterium]
MSGKVRVAPAAGTHAVERLAGNLIGLRVAEIRSVEEIETLVRRLMALVELQPPTVVCCDYRGLRTLDDETAAAAVQAMRAVNAKLQRSAVLLPGSSSNLRLQIERLCRDARDAGSPRRRVCSDAAEAKAWLGSSLDEEERRALDRFLASGDAARGLVSDRP